MVHQGAMRLNGLRVTRKFAKSPCGLHDREGFEYFREAFVRYNSKLAKYTIFIVFL